MASENATQHSTCVFDRLSTDVLNEILYLSLPADRYPRPLIYEAPLLYTAVCRQWSNIVISSPKFWTKLHVYFPYTNLIRNTPFDREPSKIGSSEWHIRPHILQKWLQRSSTLPLSISIFCSAFERIDQLQPGSYAFTLLKELVLQAHRWTTLEIQAPQKLIFDILSMGHRLSRAGTRPPLADVFPVLDTIRANFAPGFDEGLGGPLNILTLPTLRHVSLGHKVERFLSRASWRTITRLSAHVVLHHDEALNILRMCTVLEACSLTLAASAYETPERFFTNLYDANQQQVTLPSLKRLLIHGEEDENHTLCGFLDTPQLEHFLFYPNRKHATVTPYSAPWDGPWGESISKKWLELDPSQHSPVLPLYTFLERCTTLKTLTLNPLILTGTSVHSILRATPGITSLILDQDVGGGHSKVQHDVRPKICNFDFNLYPLLRQELVIISLVGETNTITLGAPLLPNLKNFEVLRFHLESEAKTQPSVKAQLFVEFFKKRIRSLQGSPDSNGKVATLERIKMELCHPQATENVDIYNEIKQHGVSMGRRIGKDLVVEVSYPWKEAPDPNNVRQRMQRDTEMMRLDKSDGVDMRTDDTWSFNEV